MLTMIEKLQSLVSRQFVVSYFVPLVFFSALNAGLLAWQIPELRSWLPSQFGGLKGFYAIPVFLAIAVVAYVFSSVNVYLREMLEGERLPAWVEKRWTKEQQKRRDAKETCLRTVRDERLHLRLGKPDWRKKLIDASDAGHAAPNPAAGYDADHAAAAMIKALEAKRISVSLITSAEFAAAVTALATVLGQVDRGSNPALQADYSKLIQLADYAEEIANIKFSNALVDLERSFGDDTRATRMGNVAAALDAYGKTRYAIDLSVYWSRMQVAIQDKKWDPLESTCRHASLSIL